MTGEKNRRFQISLNPTTIGMVLGMVAIIGGVLKFGAQQERIEQGFNKITNIQDRMIMMDEVNHQTVVNTREYSLRISTLEKFIDEHKIAGGVEHPVGVIFLVKELAAKVRSLERETYGGRPGASMRSYGSSRYGDRPQYNDPEMQ